MHLRNCFKYKSGEVSAKVGAKVGAKVRLVLKLEGEMSECSGGGLSVTLATISLTIYAILLKYYTHLNVGWTILTITNACW